MIRVNSVHPTAVDTGMIQNSATYELFAADLPEAERTRDVMGERFATLNLLPIPWVEPIDISNAVLWLASDESRYVTGVTLPIDAGLLIK
jgi:NAD(P)-dependent dehydrogenase (short-subunit alcohol dehydrogenase family)